MGRGFVGFKCPKCGGKIIDYAGNSIEQYCSKCDFTVDTRGNWHGGLKKK